MLYWSLPMVPYRNAIPWAGWEISKCFLSRVNPTSVKYCKMFSPRWDSNRGFSVRREALNPLVTFAALNYKWSYFWHWPWLQNNHCIKITPTIAELKSISIFRSPFGNKSNFEEGSIHFDIQFISVASCRSRASLSLASEIWEVLEKDFL